VDLKLLRHIVKALLNRLERDAFFDLGVYLVAAAEMTRLNEGFLKHKGETDVITFDYSEKGRLAPLHGEIFVCTDEALRQAYRFRTTWQSELVRYILHGVLHLQGFDDSRASARRAMKRQENHLLRRLSAEFDLSKLALRTARGTPKMAL
jgi:probable rRNA maturation factor